LRPIRTVNETQLELIMQLRSDLSDAIHDFETAAEDLMSSSDAHTTIVCELLMMVAAEIDLYLEEDVATDVFMKLANEVDRLEAQEEKRRGK